MNEFETGLPNQVALVADDTSFAFSAQDKIATVAGGGGSLPRGTWVNDPLINDERYVAVRIKGACLGSNRSMRDKVV